MAGTAGVGPGVRVGLDVRAGSGTTGAGDGLNAGKDAGLGASGWHAGPEDSGTGLLFKDFPLFWLCRQE